MELSAAVGQALRGDWSVAVRAQVLRSEELPLGTLRQVYRQAGLDWGLGIPMKYAVIIERGPTTYGATVPDLPGCVAVAATREEVATLIQEAIGEHIALLRASGLPVPPPTTDVLHVHVG